MKNRAIYIGIGVNEKGFFLNFGMTGNVELRDEHATYKYTFYPDGTDAVCHLTPDELYFVSTDI